MAEWPTAKTFAPGKMLQECMICGGKEGETYLIGATWRYRSFRYDIQRCDECFAAVAMNEADGEL